MNHQLQALSSGHGAYLVTMSSWTHRWGRFKTQCHISASDKLNTWEIRGKKGEHLETGRWHTEYHTQMRTMVLDYLPTWLGYFLGVNVGKYASTMVRIWDKQQTPEMKSQ